MHIVLSTQKMEQSDSGVCDDGSPMTTEKRPHKPLKRYDSRGNEVRSNASPRTKRPRVDAATDLFFPPQRAQTGVITIDVGKVIPEVLHSLENHLERWNISQIEMGDERTGDEAAVTEYSLSKPGTAGYYTLSVHEADVEESAVIIKGMKDEDGRQCR